MNLRETVREALRVKGYAANTEKTYLHWIMQYAKFLRPVHPREAGGDGVRRFLTHLAVDRHVSASTQNQALAALLFLYGLYEIEIGGLDFLRAKKDVHLPRVLTVDETMRLMDELSGVYKIMGQLMYGGGLRLMECLRLRVKDVDIERQVITLRDTKSNRDRVTCLPVTVVPALRLHLAKVKAQHQEDLANGLGEVELPYALDRKYPNAGLEWGWQYVFPAGQLSRDPWTGRLGRHHIYETSVQRAVKAAARQAGISGPVGPHTLRHCFATHLLEGGTDIRTIQELLGHKDLKTTMVYTHVVRGAAVRSPLDRVEFAHGDIKRRVLVES